MKNFFENTKNPLKNIIIVLLVILLCRVLTLATNGMNLFFDEAQYWHWSKGISFGYFSKPPVVAWVIALTTAIFGDAEWSIRLGSSLAHFGTALTLFFVGRELYSSKVGFWSAVVFATLPGVSFSSLVISTDPFLMFFWALSLFFLIRSLQTNNIKWWLALGVAVGFGFLSKYAMIAFILSLAVYLIWEKEQRKVLKSKGLWVSFTVVSLVYLPNFIWNASNGFVSYVHTKANANLSGELFHSIKSLEFIGSQFGVFGIFFGLLLFLAVTIKKTTSEEQKEDKSCISSGRFLFSFSLPLIVIMIIEGFLSRANANWAAPSYVAASVLVTAWLLGRGKEDWLKWTVIFHVFLAVVGYSFNGFANVTGIELSAKTDPMKRVRKWDEIGLHLTLIKNEYPDAVMLFDERKILTPMLYYMYPYPFDAVKWNPSGEIHDHYDLTTDMNKHKGNNFLFVTRGENADSIAPHFEKTIMLDDIQIPIYENYKRSVRVFLLSGFKGY